MDLTATFVRNITGVYGDAGRAWLAGLPSLLRECESRWHLTLGAPYELSYNYVAPATRANGERVVLKAGPPHHERLDEIAAIRACDGRGMVRLIEADTGLGVMLLEHLAPGTMLSALDDDDNRTEIAARIMLKIRRPPPGDHRFPTLEQWSQALPRTRARFDGGTGPIPAQLFERAERLWPELLASSPEAMLLHGDLHHENILGAQREPWLAIDPHGVVGDPGFEVGPFLSNHLLDLPDPPRALRRRVALLSEVLAIPRDRLIKWGIAFCVMSACWSTEDVSGDAKTEYSSGMDRASAVGKMLTEMR